LVTRHNLLSNVGISGFRVSTGAALAPSACATIVR
jgi:hypothetical protein